MVVKLLNAYLKKAFLTLRKCSMSVGRIDDILQSLEIKQKQKRKHQLVKLKRKELESTSKIQYLRNNRKF